MCPSSKKDQVVVKVQTSLQRLPRKSCSLTEPTLFPHFVRLCSSPTPMSLLSSVSPPTPTPLLSSLNSLQLLAAAPPPRPFTRKSFHFQNLRSDSFPGPSAAATALDWKSRRGGPESLVKTCQNQARFIGGTSSQAFPSTPAMPACQHCVFFGSA